MFVGVLWAVSGAVKGGIGKSYGLAVMRRCSFDRIGPAGFAISLVAAWRCVVGPVPDRSVTLVLKI
jgi:hypothetical protein